MKRLFAMLLAACMTCSCLILFVSCREKDPPPTFEEGIYERGGAGERLFRNYFFYYDNNQIKYQMLDDPQPGGLPIYGDTLSGTDDNPFWDMTAKTPYIFVDEQATQENNGVPVLLIIYQYFHITTKKDGWKLGSFDMATNRLTVIKDDFESNVLDPGIYGNWLFYSTREPEQGTILHRMRTDGSDLCSMKNPEKKYFRMQGVYQNKIYYQDYAKGTLYCADWNFENETYLFEGISGPTHVFVANGYAYYLAHAQKQQINEQHSTSSYDLCRRSVTDPSKEETVLSNVINGQAHGSAFYYNPLDSYKSFTFDGTDAHNYGAGDLYLYDTVTGESRLVYSTGEEPIMIYMRARSEQYVMLRESYIKASGRSGYGNRICVNLQTGESVVIPE